MGVTITYKKQEQEEQYDEEQPLLLNDQDIIDELDGDQVFQELVEVNEQTKVLKDKLKVWDKHRTNLEKTIFEKVDQHRSAGMAVQGKSVAGDVEITAMGKSSKVTDVEKAFEYLEDAKPNLGYELMTFSITKLREYLTKPQFESITEEEFSSKRRVKL